MRWLPKLFVFVCVCVGGEGVTCNNAFFCAQFSFKRFQPNPFVGVVQSLWVFDEKVLNIRIVEGVLIKYFSVFLSVKTFLDSLVNPHIYFNTFSRNLSFVKWHVRFTTNLNFWLVKVEEHFLINFKHDFRETQGILCHQTKV